MRLDIARALRAEGEEFPFSLEVPLSEASVLGEPVAFAGPARLNGWVAAIGQSIRLRGILAFEASARCMRCLAETMKSFETSVDALFVLAPEPANPDLYLYEGDSIDPTDMATDAAVLAFPMQWNCSGKCKGLCPVCGADRNLISCSCRMEVTSKHPFSALQQLLTEDESEV